MKKRILAVKNISFSYPETGMVLNDISIELSKNKKTAIIGPNGSGKTTLFLLMCGIIKPHSGEILVNEISVKYGKFNTEIGYLFQMPDDQLFSTTIKDDVAFGPLNMKLTKVEVEERTTNALKKVNCMHIIERSPHHLSGGEKRMAAMATILSMMPEVILLDEPTSNLDARNRRNVIELVSSIKNTMLIASHDLEFLLETCSKVIIIDKGKIIEKGPIKEVMGNDKLMKEHGLEKPHSLIPHLHG